MWLPARRFYIATSVEQMHAAGSVEYVEVRGKATQPTLQAVFGLLFMGTAEM
jgi:hypothetical protein